MVRACACGAAGSDNFIFVITFENSIVRLC